jgi:hypothetical protein
MNESSPDPFHGLNPADLMAAAAMPTDGGADTIPLTARDLPSLEEIATAFPDLEILDLIGHGGMSAVFRARQPKLDRVVALKVLPKSLAATPGFAERFTARAACSHGSAIRTSSLCMTSARAAASAYLIMEYVDGVNLRQAMRAGRFTPEQALNIIPAICDALQFAHTQGVLHRDIKPENILLDSKGRVKIADFGIAKIISEDAVMRCCSRKAAQARHRALHGPGADRAAVHVDHRADIYSLGVVFYEMLTGELPLGRFAAPSEKSLQSVATSTRSSFERWKKSVAAVSRARASSRRRSKASAPCPSAQRALARRFQSFEYKSKRRCSACRCCMSRRALIPRRAKSAWRAASSPLARLRIGVFAFGGYARGWFACGGLAVGGVAIGGLSIGLISWGGFALALLLAVGGLSIGPFATGGAALGWNAMGGIAAGWNAVGGIAIAQHGMGGKVIAPDVVKSLAEMPRALQLMSEASWLTSMGSFLWLPLMLPMLLVSWWARRQLEIGDGADQASERRASARVFWLFPALALLCGVLWWMMLRWTTSGMTDAARFIIPTVIGGVGCLLFVLSLPLWLRLVPMNSFYGVRLPSTFVSDERWYDVNAVFGRHLTWWSLTVVGAGIAGFYQLPRHQDAYPWAAITLTLVAVAASVVSTLWWMRQHPVNAPALKKNRLVSWGGQCLVAVVIAMFIKSFIAGAYKIPQGNEPGVAKDSRWIASHLDTGFSSGDLIIFEHESDQYWIARVVARENKGLLLKRGGSPDEFFMPWDKIVGKMLFSHFSPDAATGKPDITAGKAARFVHVISGVQKPRSMLWKEGMTVLHAVRDAGGFTPFAHPSKTKVVRGDRAHLVNLKDQIEPFVLQPEDQIIIPE